MPAQVSQLVHDVGQDPVHQLIDHQQYDKYQKEGWEPALKIFLVIIIIISISILIIKRKDENLIWRSSWSSITASAPAGWEPALPCHHHQQQHQHQQNYQQEEPALEIFLVISIIIIISRIMLRKDENLLWRSSWSATVLPASWASSTGSTFNPLNCQMFKWNQNGIWLWPPAGWKASCFWQVAFTASSIWPPQKRNPTRTLLIKNPSDSLLLATLGGSW